MPSTAPADRSPPNLSKPCAKKSSSQPYGEKGDNPLTTETSSATWNGSGLGVTRWVLGLSLLYLAGCTLVEAQLDLQKAKELLRQRQYYQARLSCDRAVLRTRHPYAALLLRAEVHYQLCEYQETIRDADLAMEFQTVSPAALYWKARAEYQLDDLGGALVDLKVAHLLGYRSDSQFWLGKICDALGNTYSAGLFYYQYIQQTGGQELDKLQQAETRVEELLGRDWDR